MLVQDGTNARKIMESFHEQIELKISLSSFKSRPGRKGVKASYKTLFMKNYRENVLRIIHIKFM